MKDCVINKCELHLVLECIKTGKCFCFAFKKHWAFVALQNFPVFWHWTLTLSFIPSSSRKFCSSHNPQFTACSELLSLSWWWLCFLFLIYKIYARKCVKLQVYLESFSTLFGKKLGSPSSLVIVKSYRDFLNKNFCSSFC